ncbi:unnamed protein product [Clavelina lepadiformis]|uniref:Uncharacterized protein n=1 Tax=Clavelina lepadiformis TaxID=159417 RepID=A0ABP0GFM8_CLALP
MDGKVLQWVGAGTSFYFLLKLVTRVIDGSRLYFLSRFPDFSKYGKWSVVTGSTDGIGKAAAFQLASRGQNIVLISRTEEKLRKVAEEIEAKYNVKTKYLKIDFSHSEEIYKEIAHFLAGLDIGTLINNVGVDQQIGSFHEHPDLSALIQNMTRVNVTSVTKMTQIVLPGMVERKRGLIINVSSLAAVKPVKYISLYGATKAFVNHFSQALSYEYESKGITIQSCMPSFVATNFTSHLPVSKIIMTSPTNFSKSWLATVDKARWTHGYVTHAIHGWALRLLPLGLIQALLGAWMEWIMDAQRKNEKLQ